MLVNMPGIDPEDDLAVVPLLRYPFWVEQVPPEITELADEGFDTVVRLPFDQRFSERLGLDKSRWLKEIQTALKDVSDQIVLLLGVFDEVQIEDRAADTSSLIRPQWAQRTVASSGGTRETIRITRNGDLSSRWIVHRRPIPGMAELAGEVAVGWRLSTSSEAALVQAVGREGEGHPSTPFHLFFPTRIASGLPLLLHGYFEVDAARTGFYRGSRERNQTILDSLAHLVADGTHESAVNEEIDLASMANLLAAAGEPEDEAARSFHDKVLALLDDVPWVPVGRIEGAPDSACPRDVFAWKPRITELVSSAFSSDYVARRVALRLPDPELTDVALALIGSRQQYEPPDYWSLVSELCRPGDAPLWAPEEVDARFLALLDLFEALDVEDRSKTESLLADLRGDESSRLLPSAGTDGGRVMLPVPDPSEGVGAGAANLVMARARVASAGTLDPPPELDLAFLPDGLLDNEAAIDRAKPLGVRPFTVDNVLDRLNGIGSSEVDGQRLLRFLWMLLSRERLSPYATVNSAKQADAFDPSRWFWCQPRRADDETGRRTQQRERYLADVPVPRRDGEWRAAGTVAFGEDWAAWLDAEEAAKPTSSSLLRVEAYRAMERLAPGDHCFLASPDQLVALLPAPPPTLGTEGDNWREETSDEATATPSVTPSCSGWVCGRCHQSRRLRTVKSGRKPFPGRDPIASASCKRSTRWEVGHSG